MRKLIVTLIVSGIMILGLNACALIKPVPDPFIVSINTTSDLNPDADDRSSPVVLRIYELNDATAFKEKDFFDLYDDDKEVLAKAYVNKQEMELNPNESRKVEIVLDPNTKYLGFLVAYRDIDSAKWREVHEVQYRKATGIPVFGKRGLTVDLKKNKIVVASH